MPDVVKDCILIPLELYSFVLLVAVDLVIDNFSPRLTVTDFDKVIVLATPPGFTATTYTLLSHPLGTVIVSNGNTASPGFIPVESLTLIVLDVAADDAVTTILSIVIIGSQGAYLATDI